MGKKPNQCVDNIINLSVISHLIIIICSSSPAYKIGRNTSTQVYTSAHFSAAAAPLSCLQTVDWRNCSLILLDVCLVLNVSLWLPLRRRRVCSHLCRWRKRRPEKTSINSTQIHRNIRGLCIDFGNGNEENSFFFRIDASTAPFNKLKRFPQQSSE